MPKPLKRSQDFAMHVAGAGDAGCGEFSELLSIAESLVSLSFATTQRDLPPQCQPAVARVIEQINWILDNEDIDKKKEGEARGVIAELENK